MTPQNFKVFIASSLSLRQDRQEVEDAINEFNEGTLKDSYFHFSIFDYVKDDGIVQKLELGDAQDPIRRFLYESLVFILIVRGRVGNLTINEFEDAMARFQEGRYPQYLFIFYDEVHSRDSIIDDKSISFPEFENKYLARYELDSAYRLIKHKKGYYIPFGGGYGSFKSQLIKNLSNLVRSGEWPFPGSLRTTDLKKTDFYTDTNRLSQCHESIYFSRPFDKRLEESIDNSQIVFINGVSLSGKTRAAMNLLAKREDGWAYIFPGAEVLGREELVTSEMEHFVKYIDAPGRHPSHYVFIDDAHELDFTEDENDKKVQRRRKAIECFLGAAIKRKFKLIVTSTRRFQDTFLSDFINEDDNSVLIISIREMRDAEFSKALSFFNGYGLVKHDKRLGYNTPGAILIDLPSIKITYLSYLKTEQERISSIRHCFLKSIKAASIWKNTNFGELSILNQLTGYFLEQEGVENWTEKEVFDEAISPLLTSPQSGVTRAAETRLNIQEYVYRYIIDYEGNIKEGDADYSEAEKLLVGEIMSYCEVHEKTSSLTMQACKLGSRSDYRPIVGSWLYELFINEGEDAKSSWIASLRKERSEKELHPSNDEDDRYLFFYSKMFSNAFDADTDFNTALAIFNRASKELRSPNLLADLMRCAKNEADWDVIESLPEYNKYVFAEKRPFVLARLMSLQKSFSKTLIYFNTLAQNFNYTPKQIATYKLRALDGPIRDESDRQIQRDVFPIETGIENLAKNVKSESDFLTLLDVLRQFYFAKVNDRTLLIQISERKLNILSRKDELTIVDLLSILTVSSLRKAIQGAYGSGSERKSERWSDYTHATDDFIRGTLYSSFFQTLSNPYTDETMLRSTASAIVNALIESYARHSDSSSGLSYNELRDGIMKASIIAHPIFPDKKINLMDCYAYSHMLKARDCGVNETRNLLEEYLIPHIHDNDNPLVLSVYLLNSMISTIWKDTKGKEKEKSERTRRSVIQKILPLYEQFHVRPDAITYNILIRSAKNEEEAVHHITQMVKAGVNPDLYTLCYLASKTNNIQGVLGLVDLPEEIILPVNYELRDVIPDHVRNLDTFIAQKSILLDTEEFWKQVFFRQLKTDDDRSVALACFNYLKNDKPELLSDGVLLNVFIQNNLNLIQFDAIKAFVLDNYGKSFPDSFTFSIISNRLAELHGDDKRRQIHFYNDLTRQMYSEGRLDWDALIPRRLYLFDSYNEHLEFIFLDRDEEDNEFFFTKTVTAIGYLQVIKAKQYNPSIEFIYDSLKRIVGFTPEIQKQAEDIFPFTPQYSHNQEVVHSYQRGEISDIRKAMYKLNWEDYTSATHSFNRILDVWLKKTPFDPNRFDVVMKLYKEFLSEKGPNSETLSRLVKNANSYDDVTGYIYPAYDEAKIKRIELRLDSHFLSSVYRFGHSVEELNQFTQAFEQRGGITSIGNVASMIRYMLRYKHDQHASQLLKDVTEYLFGTNSKTLASYGSPISILTKNNVNGQILYSAIVYAEENRLFERDALINALVVNYKKELLNFNDDGLLVQLLNQKRENNKRFLYMLLTRLLEKESVARIPEPILSLAAEGIEDYADYCHLIKAIKRSGCIFIEPIVLPLMNRLYKWIKMRNHPSLKSIRQLYSRIVTYSKLNNLSNGHFLPECSNSLSDDSWSERSLNSANVRVIVNEIVGKRSLKEQIKFAIRNLPMPYVLALKSIYHYEKPRLVIDDDCRSYISSFEEDYARMIHKGQVSFDEITQLPKEWENSGWIPGVEIVSALYLKYNSLSLTGEGDETKEEAKTYFHSINSTIALANKNKWSIIRIMYSYLGKLTKDEIERHHYTMIDKRLFVEKTDDSLANAISKNRLSFEEIVRLAAVWNSTGWQPGVNVLASLFIQYKNLSKSYPDDSIRKEARKYYLSMCGAINSAKTKNSKSLRFFYNGLGRLDEDQNHYIVVDRQAFYNLTKSTINSTA